MVEAWKAVVGFEGRYEVSDLGRVRSLDRVVACVCRGRAVQQHKRGRILKASASKSGHLHLSLGVGNQRLVHRLVLEAFTGPCPDGQEGCHGDGKPANNRETNLRWDFPINNVADQDRHGTRLRGERMPTARLKEADVREIKELRGKVSQVRLAQRFGVGKSTIQAAMDGRTWSHVR